MAVKNGLNEFFEPLMKVHQISYKDKEFGIYTQKKLIIKNVSSIQLLNQLIKQYGEQKVYDLYKFCSDNKIKDLIVSNFGFNTN